MRLEAPDWWYRPERSWQAHLLSPLAAVYDTATRRRMSRSPSVRLSVPVICVGNFTAGGAGKTPCARAIAARLTKLGARPGFVTRGFGGVIAGPHLVDLTRDTARDVGDEALLLAADAPTVVSADRATGGHALLERCEVDAVILDDGLQNPSLHKTLTFAVVDAAVGLGNGAVVPAGPLRASFPFQRQHVDALVLLSSGELGRGGGTLDCGGKPRLVASLRPDPDFHHLANQPVVVFAGIGRPDKVFATVAALGAKVRATHAFPDHHRFLDSEAETLLAEADRWGATLVTTEKDWVRLAGDDSPALSRLRTEAVALPVSVNFERDDLAQLDALLTLAMKSAVRGQSAR